MWVNVNFINIPSLKKITVIALTTALISSCSDDMSDIYGFVNEVKSRSDSYVEPLPAFHNYDSFEYSEDNLRDPFLPKNKKVRMAKQAPRPDSGRRKELLERYPLDSLRMVGGLGKNGGTWGLIRDPNGTIHRVQKGNHLGQNFGKIVAVSETGIQLQELISDAVTGEWVSRGAQLSLGEK